MFSLRECNVLLRFSPGISIAEVRRAIDRPAINLDSFLRLHRCLAHRSSMSYTAPEGNVNWVRDSSRIVPRFLDLSLFGARLREWKVRRIATHTTPFVRSQLARAYPVTNSLRGYNRKNDRWFSESTAPSDQEWLAWITTQRYSTVLHLSAMNNVRLSFVERS